MSFVVTEPITEGVAVLHTSFGDILVELWKRECPKAVRNFVQLALEGHYDGVPFHRIAPGFIAQAGGSDDCIYDEGDFPIETNQRLKFNRRGLLAMASDPNTKTNMSQFFFTLDATPNLQNQHTLFGRVSGDSLFNLLKLNDTEIEPGTEDKPVYPPTIKSIEIRVDPFEDDADPIRPRITAAERKEQERAKREMKAERAKQREQGKRKGTKNKFLISFGDEAEEDESLQSSLPKTKFKSAHDALPNDSRLSAKVVDDRGFSAELPPELMGPPPSAAGSKRRKEDEGEGREEKRSRPEPSASTSKLDEARKARDKAPKSEAEKRKEEIAKVQAELKKMTGKSTSDDDESSASSSKKKKRTGPSLLQLEREKYLSRGGGASSSRGGKKAKGGDEDDVLSVLEGFRSRLSEAAKVGPKKKENAAEGDKEEKEKLHGIDLNDDELDDDLDDWMLHSLKFRKDATEDFHKLSDYAVVDPLAKNDKTLDEMKSRAESQRRRYAGEDRERGGGRGEGSRGGGGGRGGYEDRRGGGGGGRGGGRYDDRRGGGGGGGRSEQYGSSRDRPEVRGGDWKKDRVSTADLA